MKNKNLLWVVAGAGLGVVAFYLFCKKEVYETIEVINEDGEVEQKSVPVGGGGGGFFAPTTPVSPVALTTAIPTTSINILPSSPTPTPTPTPAPTPTPTPTTAVTTTMAPSSAGVTPTTTIPIGSSTPPKVVGAIQPILSSTATQTKSAFSGFDGGGDSFEVGECLHDLY